MKKVVIFGSGEMAEVVDFYLRHDSPYEPVAFTLNQEFIKESTICGKPVVPFEEVQKQFPPSAFSFITAVGYSKWNELREKKYLEAKSKGYSFVSYVSTKANIWTQDIGENCLIFEDNTIQPFTKIGNNVVMWSGNHLGHHSTIADNTFVSSHVVVSGGVKIGRNCFIGVNATIRDHITIGDRCLIAMGMRVMESVPDGAVVK